MQCVHSAFLHGRTTKFVQVELVKYRGIPQIVVVGMAAKMVSEVKERLRSAFKYIGASLPHCHYTINLTPAGMIKKSTGLDLAIAVAFMSELGLLRPRFVLRPDQLWLGELGLDGSVKPIAGLLEMACIARASGYRELWCAASSMDTLQLVSDLKIHGIHHIRELMTGFRQVAVPESRFNPIFSTGAKVAEQLVSEREWNSLQRAAILKRVIMVAAAGWHHVCVVGPPGFGKTTVARILVDLLPPPLAEERLEILRVRSCLPTYQFSDEVHRPLIALTNTCSLTQLIGNDQQRVIPELTKAHRGVLFIDEFTEFLVPKLEALKPGLEFGWDASFGSDPEMARFLLVAAANPCRCGMLGMTNQTCTCPPHLQNQILRKISAAWFDRIDLCLRALPDDLQDLVQEDIDFYTAKQQVLSAWEKQHRRWQKPHTLNGMVAQNHQLHMLSIDEDARKLLEKARAQLHLSPRAVNKIVKVARTVDDLDSNGEGLEPITAHAVAEGLQYRSQLIFS